MFLGIRRVPKSARQGLLPGGRCIGSCAAFRFILLKSGVLDMFLSSHSAYAAASLRMENLPKGALL